MGLITGEDATFGVGGGSAIVGWTFVAYLFFLIHNCLFNYIYIIVPYTAYINHAGFVDEVLVKGLVLDVVVVFGAVVVVVVPVLPAVVVLAVFVVVVAVVSSLQKLLK